MGEVKQAKILMMFGGLCLAVCGALTTRWSLKVSEALAPSDGSTITASCTDPTLAAFTPTTFAITIAPPTPGLNSPDCGSYSVTTVLTDPVNGQANPSGTSSCPGGQKLRIAYDLPNMKLAGLQCQTNVAATTLTAGNASYLSEDTDVDVSISDDGAGAASAVRVDNADAATRTVIGTSSITGITEANDGGVGDLDSDTNGEIAIGGEGGASSVDLYVGVTVFGGNPDASSENTNWEFTPAAGGGGGMGE